VEGFLRNTAGIIKRLDLKRFEAVVLCSASVVDRYRRTIRSNDVTFSPLYGTNPERSKSLGNMQGKLHGLPKKVLFLPIIIAYCQTSASGNLPFSDKL